MTLLSSPAMTSPSSSSLALPSWETQSSLPASLLPATSCQMRRPATSAAGAVSIVCADPSSWPQGQWAERQGLGTKIEGNTRTSPCIFFFSHCSSKSSLLPANPAKHECAQLNIFYCLLCAGCRPLKQAGPYNLVGGESPSSQSESLLASDPPFHSGAPSPNSQTQALYPLTALLSALYLHSWWATPGQAAAGPPARGGL